MTAPPGVALDTAGDAVGMASMVAALLRDNLADSWARARVAEMARGSVVLRAHDRDLGVTVTFGPGGVVVAARAAQGTAVLGGDWLTMAAVCSGTRSPLRALARGELHVALRRPVRALLAAGFVLRVPRRLARAGDSAEP